MPNSNQIKIL